jgi:hypothetical protein
MDRKNLIANLEKIRIHLCCYIGAPCDCKYGVTHIGDCLYERTGCPEVRKALQIINMLTDEEYIDIEKRYYDR